MCVCGSGVVLLEMNLTNNSSSTEEPLVSCVMWFPRICLIELLLVIKCLTAVCPHEQTWSAMLELICSCR